MALSRIYVFTCLIEKRII